MNSAAVSPHEPAETSALETWNESIDINLRGTFLCCQAAARVMLEKGKMYAYGKPEDVLTTNNINNVYGVESLILDSGYGKYIVPIKAK